MERGVLSRIESLAIGVKNMGKSKNLCKRLSWSRKDELSLLAGAIDCMMEERVNTIGELAAMIGHDLRNSTDWDFKRGVLFEEKIRFVDG